MTFWILLVSNAIGMWWATFDTLGAVCDKQVKEDFGGEWKTSVVKVTIDIDSQPYVSATKRVQSVKCEKVQQSSVWKDTVVLIRDGAVTEPPVVTE